MAQDGGSSQVNRTVGRVRAIELAARGATARHIADDPDVGRSLRTVQRWMADPEFQDEVRQLRGAALTSTVTALENAARVAVGVLGEAMREGHPITVRARAAKDILALLPTVSGHAEIERQLAELRDLAAKVRGKADTA